MPTDRPRALSGDRPATVPGALERAAAAFPDRGIAIFDSRGRRHERRTWGEILGSVRRAAGCWRAAGVRSGDRVVIVQPTSWEWLDAWLGAVWLGALPVAVAPGTPMGPAEGQVRKVEGVVERLDARRVLASEVFASAAAAPGGVDDKDDGEDDGEEAPGILAPRTAERFMTPEALFGLAPAQVERTRVEGAGAGGDDVAFLQLTSGSTGTPRAVQITHRGILHNARAIDEGIGAPRGAPTSEWADSLVSWLPLHHDMGLVGCVFVAMLAGIDLWLLQPTTFLARPKIWLQQLGCHGETYCHAPNFGYQLCLERLDAADAEDLDLSSWAFAMTGAEMIRPETVRGFCERFAPAGFRPEVFRPGYGLAEATLAVTMDLAGEGLRARSLPGEAKRDADLLDPDLAEVACLGPPVTDTAVRIVGPSGRTLDDGTIGEVAVRGPGVFTGYWNDPESTAEALVDGELRTGDLGFVEDGELYLTGRTKDLLIVRGNNLMPHEIEWLAEKVTGGGGALRSGAFSVSHGGRGEEAVVVVETRERDPAVIERQAREIRLEISRGLGLVLADLLFVRRGEIPKTSSGKVRRRQLRDLYLRDELRTP